MISELKLLSPNLQHMSQGWRLISWRPTFPERKNTIHVCTHALKLVWAHLPSRKWKACKTFSSNELQATWLSHWESLKLTSCCQCGIWKEEVCLWRTKGKNKDKTAKYTNIKCLHTHTHVQHPTHRLHKFCLMQSVYRKPCWHPAEWSQPVLNPTALLINNIKLASQLAEWRRQPAGRLHCTEEAPCGSLMLKHLFQEEWKDQQDWGGIKLCTKVNPFLLTQRDYINLMGSCQSRCKVLAVTFGCSPAGYDRVFCNLLFFTSI